MIESMNGARFVHDQLELAGWEVEIADAPEGQGPGAAGRQDRQDRRLGAGRALPPRPGAGDLAARPRRCARERERARFRLHLVRHRTALKNRIHATLHRPSATPARSRTCSASPAASCSTGSSSPSPGRRRSTPSLQLIDELDAPDRRAASAELRRARRRPPLRPAADDRARDRLGARPTRSPPRSATSAASPAPRS